MIAQSCGAFSVKVMQYTIENGMEPGGCFSKEEFGK